MGLKKEDTFCLLTNWIAVQLLDYRLHSQWEYLPVFQSKMVHLAENNAAREYSMGKFYHSEPCSQLYVERRASDLGPQSPQIFWKYGPCNTLSSLLGKRGKEDITVRSRRKWGLYVIDRIFSFPLCWLPKQYFLLDAFCALCVHTWLKAGDSDIEKRS